MSSNLPRIPPVPSADWTDDVREVFAIGEGPDARRNGSKFNVLLTLANHPALSASFLTYHKMLMTTSTLPPRLREIIILRVTVLQRSQYEWIQHSTIGRSIGLSDDHIAGIKVGADAAVWSEFERNAIRAVDQLHSQSQIDDATWNALSDHLHRQQMMELLFMVGTYTMLCYALNSMGVQPEQ